MIGVRESARTNTIMVFFKLAVLLLFLVLGVTAFNADNFIAVLRRGRGHRRHGDRGDADLLRLHRLRRGLDLQRGGQGTQARPADRDHRLARRSRRRSTSSSPSSPSGALPFDKLKGQDAPLATALSEGAGFDWAANIISFGALVAITSVVLTLLYGQSRILFAMSRDGLMPKRHREGQREDAARRSGSSAICGVLFAVLAAFVPLKEIVKLVNIGTLFAFVVVNLGVIILRRTKPGPASAATACRSCPWFPIIGTCCAST